MSDHVRACLHRLGALVVCAALAVPLWGVATAAAGSSPGTQRLLEAQDRGRHVEVAGIEGILDGVSARHVLSVLERAERQQATALVIQIDSAGGVSPQAVTELVDAILDASVPVITWVGPPGAQAAHDAAVVALAGHVVAMAPASSLGPVGTLDLRDRDDQSDAVAALLARIDLERGRSAAASLPADEQLSADRTRDLGLVDAVAPRLQDLMRDVDGLEVTVGGVDQGLDTDPDGLSVRFQSMGLLGRAMHAVAQPSIVYMLLLLGFVGLIFEAFHPSNGPAGASGLVGLALAAFGMTVLGGSWLAAGLIAAGLFAMSVDLRMQALGVLTVLGAGGLVAGSLLLFTSPGLQVSRWILAAGILGMMAFMLGAMTKVLRDLRAVASGEREIIDLHELIAHPASEDADDA